MIKNIDTKLLHPHPHNPRKDLGDLSELSESIKISGILQNLTVVPAKEGYTVIIGHRRLAAAKLAGLEEVPCAVIVMDEKTQISTMLLENIQRNDLTVFEQAQGFQMMLDLGETIEDISKQTGFSDSTVRRRVKLLELDQEKLKKSMVRKVSLQDYAKLEQIKNIDLRNEVLEAIGTNNFEWKLQSAIDKEERPILKAKLIKELQTFATEQEESGNAQYIEMFYNFKIDDQYKRPEDADSKKYFYVVSNNNIRLYKEFEKETKTITPEEKEYNLREARLKKLTKQAYRMRYDFVKNFTASKKHIKEIMSFLMSMMLRNIYLDTDDILKMLDIDIIENPENNVNSWIETEKKKRDIITEKYNEQPERILFVTLYFGTCDSGTNKYYHARSWEKKIAYDANEKLDKLYDFLISVGYEMSDEEQQLRDGTHELFAEFI